MFGMGVKQIMKLSTFITPEEQEDDSLATHKVRVNTFFKKGMQCEYRNHVLLEDQAASNENKISISNNICKNNGDTFEKVTIVRFNSQVVTIKDEYSFLSRRESTEAGGSKRVQLFKRPLSAEEDNTKKRLTKNLAKNFIKAFVNYLEDSKNEENSSLIECKMSVLISRQKYNNSLIQRIIDEEELRPFFIDFLKHHARNWILHSKIREKTVHREAIDLFLRLCQSSTGQRGSHPALYDNSEASFELSLPEAMSSLVSSVEVKEEADNESILANSRKSDSGSD